MLFGFCFLIFWCFFVKKSDLVQNKEFRATFEHIQKYGTVSQGRTESEQAAWEYRRDHTDQSSDESARIEKILKSFFVSLVCTLGFSWNIENDFKILFQNTAKLRGAQEGPHGPS